MSGSNGCVKSKIFCDEMWNGGLLIELPLLDEGESIELQMTVPSFGELDGEFTIEDRSHTYNSERVGYIQRLVITPSE
jgi:hypothetical protein